MKFLVKFSVDQMRDEELTLEEIDRHPYQHLIISKKLFSTEGSFSTKQRGCFVIHNSFLTGVMLDVALAILKDVVVVRAEQRFDLNGVEYIGLSKHFQEVPDNVITPMYHVIKTDNDKGGAVAYSFELNK